MSEWVGDLAVVLLAAIAFKAVMGIRLPWERCPCCGRRWRDHPFIG